MTKTCIIPWGRILSAENPSHYIFMELQRANINAEILDGRFETPTRGKLHYIDDSESKARHYIWSEEEYLACCCWICKEYFTLFTQQRYLSDFNFRLMCELNYVGAVTDERVSQELSRCIQAEEDRRRREEIARREQRQLQQQLRAEEARHRREAQQNQERLLMREAQRQIRAATKEQKKKEKEVTISVREVEYQRQIRLED